MLQHDLTLEDDGQFSDTDFSVTDATSEVSDDPFECNMEQVAEFVAQDDTHVDVPDSCAKDYSHVWLRLRGFWVEAPSGAPAGICGFPGCKLRDRHSGLHETDDDALPAQRRRHTPKPKQALRIRTPVSARTLQATVLYQPINGDAASGLLERSLGALEFDTEPPFGVIAPAEAAARLGDSLCCARGVLRGQRLHELTEELISLPKPLPWGSTRSRAMTRSRKKLIWLDAAARSRADELLASGPNAASKRAVAADLVRGLRP